MSEHKLSKYKIQLISDESVFLCMCENCGAWINDGVQTDYGMDPQEMCAGYVGFSEEAKQLDEGTWQSYYFRRVDSNYSPPVFRVTSLF